MTRTARTAFVPLAVLVVLLGHPASAGAATKAAATSSTQAAGSGSWGVVATQLSASPYVKAPLALSFPITVLTPRYLWVVNTGTLPILGTTYALSTTQAAMKLEACSTTWNESTNVCTSGTITQIVTTLTSPVSTATAVAVPAAVGARVRLKATPTAAPTSVTTLTIGITVSRAQARASTTLTG